ncbi:MAG TPA: aminomethyltransferase family protein [Gemmataceae bacterium]|nr:aminomethyltransferase family protein [Gemmataceae bacterium]
MSERSPLHETTARAGAAFAEEAGWTMPLHYGDPAVEYRRAREGAALFDLSHRGKVELTGPEAEVFLHNLLTNDVKTLPYSHGRETFLCNVQGRVLASALVYRLKVFDDPAFLSNHDAFWLDVDPGLGDKVACHLDRHLISERAEIADCTPSFAHLHLAGPQAPELVAQDGITGLAAHELMQNGWGAETVQFRRNDRLGVPGYDIVCPAAQAESHWTHWRERGATPAGLRAEETLRVEACTPVYGKDVTEANLAPEVGRTPQAISYAKGCYLGQEPIVRLRDLGHVNRVLTGLRLEGSEPVPAGAKLWRDGKEAGHVTSSVYSPALGTAIALAYVRRGSTDPGTALEVEAGAARGAAQVTSLPFRVRDRVDH